MGVKSNAHCPVRHTQIKKFTASSGAQQPTINNEYFGPIPERILIALVKNNTFAGSASTNPYHFHRHDMTNLVLCVNGVQQHSEPLSMDCASTFWATRAYETWFSTTGIHHDYRAHTNALELNTKIFYIRDFGLTPDRGRRRAYKPPRQGNLSIEARFKNVNI